MCLRIVAPSFVMTTSPVLVWIYESAWPRWKEEGKLPSCPFLLVPDLFEQHQTRLPISNWLLDSRHYHERDPPLAAFMFDNLTSVGFP